MWFCHKCSIFNFSDSVFNNSSYESENSFHLLSASESEVDPDDNSISPSHPGPINHQNKLPPRIKPKTLKLLSLNCRSLRSKAKQALLHSIIETEKPDIICGQETHLDKSFSSSEVFPSGYDIFRKDRKAGAGGVFVACRPELLATQNDKLGKNNESVWITINIAGKPPLHICSFYRTTDREETPLDNLYDDLATLSQRSLPNVILLGDFNLPHIDWSNSSVGPNPEYGHDLNQKFLDLSLDFSLSQHVKDPTRENNILDLVLTTFDNNIKEVVVQSGMSDHNMVSVELNISAKFSRKKPRIVYMFKRANYGAIKDELSRFFPSFIQNLDARSTNDNWVALKEKIMFCISRHIPSKKLGSWSNTPWMTREIKRQINKKKRLYNKAKSSKKTCDWNKYKHYNNHVKYMLKHAYEDYLTTILEDSFANNKKKFWSFIRSTRNEDIGIPPLKSQNGNIVSEPKQKAEVLSSQYQSVFTQENLSQLPNLGHSPYPNLPKLTFGKAGIVKLLKDLNTSKACGPDNIPTRVLKECAEEIGPFLQAIFSQSYRNGSLPDDFRTAHISAIFKKGDRNQAANYRPVALTAIPCKIMEHIIFSHIMSHIDRHHILIDSQHGFRRGHSTESQLITTINDIAHSMDLDHGQVDAIVLDFSKAFDSVAHKRLLLKLEYYGIREEHLEWIRSWLTERTQSVRVDGELSGAVHVDSGVPQGSVLGPLFFLLYINDISDNTTSYVKLFADDCLLFRVIRNMQDAIDLQSDLNQLITWSDKWQMNFNASKCHTIHITRKTKHKVNYQYHMKGTPLLEVPHHPYLGVELDHRLDWNQHVSNITANANKALGFVKRNLSRCSRDIKETAYFTLVRPKLEYATAVWDPYTRNQISDIEMVQRRAARFVMNSYDREASVTSMLNKLGWEDLQTRRQVTRLTTLHKVVHNESPIILPPGIQFTQRVTRQNHARRFIRLSSSQSYYQLSFFPRTIKDWNSLPNNIIDLDNQDQFKSAVQRYFSMRSVA